MKNFKCVFTQSLMYDGEVLTIGAIILSKQQKISPPGRDDGSTWVVRFVDFS